MKAQKKKPYFPAEYDLADLVAIQELAKGNASKDQQIRALKWIVERAADTYGLPFFPSEQDCSTFAAGKMFVGQQIVKLTKIPRQIMEKKNG